MTDQQKVLNGPFDLETHKATFTNYLEVVITEDGTIIYAVPSHQKVMERLYASKTGRDANDVCPLSRWFDMLDWLMEETGCICAHTAGVLGKAHTDRQKDALKMLYSEGLIYA